MWFAQVEYDESASVKEENDKDELLGIALTNYVVGHCLVFSALLDTGSMMVYVL